MAHVPTAVTIWAPLQVRFFFKKLTHIRTLYKSKNSGKEVERKNKERRNSDDFKSSTSLLSASNVLWIAIGDLFGIIQPKSHHVIFLGIGPELEGYCETPGRNIVIKSLELSVNFIIHDMCNSKSFQVKIACNSSRYLSGTNSGFEDSWRRDVEDSESSRNSDTDEITRNMRDNRSRSAI